MAVTSKPKWPLSIVIPFARVKDTLEESLWFATSYEWHTLPYCLDTHLNFITITPPLWCYYFKFSVVIVLMIQLPVCFLERI